MERKGTVMKREEKNTAMKGEGHQRERRDF
jgi:hypothetical protein